MATPVATAAPRRLDPLSDRVLHARESGILTFTIYLVLFLYWYSGETFWTTQNLLQVARNFSFVAIMAIGQALVIMRELRHGGVAQIVISHRLQDIFAVGDRVMVLKRGRNVGERVIRDTTEAEVLSLIVQGDASEPTRIAPSMMGRIIVGDSGKTLPVDPFGLPDSAGPTLAVRTANRGALIAQFENDPPVPIGSRSCIFTPPRDGRLRFAINDADYSGNRGHFSVTVSIPEIRSVLAATPACGTVLR